jgi:hypothetical protein
MYHMGTSITLSVIIAVRPVTGIFYILLYIVLTQYCGRGIFTKLPTNFLSHDAYHAEYFRWTHYLLTNVYRVHTPYLYETNEGLTLHPTQGEGRSHPTCVAEGSLFFFYALGTDERRYILFKVAALDLDDIYSSVSENLCSM